MFYRIRSFNYAVNQLASMEKPDHRTELEVKTDVSLEMLHRLQDQPRSYDNFVSKVIAHQFVNYFMIRNIFQD